MGEVGIARRPQLRAVLPEAIDIGAIQHVLVRIGIVGLDPFNEFELPNHRNRPLYGDDCVHSTFNALLPG